MANEIEKNIYLVNAPAGSGKTTRIKQMIVEHTISSPKDNILCITYTNRAVDELKKGITNDHITISTIHSFINSLISPFLTLAQTKELYWDLFGERIQKRITNIDHDEKIEESNKKYIEKYGELTSSTVKDNIRSITYGETEFTSLYYGRLSHDDLLILARILMDKYPVIRNKISKKYQMIFVDEYQDTSADVLNMFYKAVKGTDTKLFFLGDKMQQIYKTYDGSFENIFSKFNTEVALETNHRSIPAIVDILNKLYNNPQYKQKVYAENKNKQPQFNPRVIISNDVNKDIEENLKEYPDTLVLYLFNRERFQEIGAISLWNVYKELEQYSFGKKYSVVDVLIDISDDNPDEMMKFLFSICEMNDYWIKRQYGNIIAQSKKNKKTFNAGVNSIISHTDKIRIKDLWIGAFEIFNDTTKTIGELFKYLSDNRIIIDSCFERIDPNHVYDKIMTVPVCEVKALYSYLKEPHISTQHGVKGESHDTVVFVATDSKNTPIAHMYKFFEVWSKTDFSLNEFESFYYSYSKYVSDIQQVIKVKSSDINKQVHNEHKSEFIEYSQEMINRYNGNKLFDIIAKEIYEAYLNNPTVTNAKKCFKDSTVYGVLSAYRLFYVGCSRARRNLTIIVNKSKVSNFISEFVGKSKSVGFDVLLEE